MPVVLKTKWGFELAAIPPRGFTSTVTSMTIVCTKCNHVNERCSTLS